MTQEIRLNKIKEFLTELNKNNCNQIDLAYFADADQQNFDDLRDAIENGGGFDIEIIYYSNAVDYLKENDPSLRESLGIASEMGFDVSNLNSETLASLLATQNERQDFEALESEINQFFEELSEEEEEEEEDI